MAQPRASQGVRRAGARFTGGATNKAEVPFALTRCARPAGRPSGRSISASLRRGDAGTLVRFTLQDGGGRTSRSPVGFHRPHAFPMRAGPRPVHPPKWPPRRELHPHVRRSKRRRLSVTSRGEIGAPARSAGQQNAPGLFLVRTEADCLVADGRVASVTGIAPACIRLEDGALICSRHTEKELTMVPAAGISPATSSFGGMCSDN